MILFLRRFRMPCAHGLFCVQNLTAKGRITWNIRLRPCFAVPPAESPSTRNNSHFPRILRTVSQFTRAATAGHRRFALYHFACLSLRRTCLAAGSPCLQLFGFLRMFFQVVVQNFTYGLVYGTHHFVVTQLCLGLSFELRLSTFMEITAVRPSRKSSPRISIFQASCCLRRIFLTGQCTAETSRWVPPSMVLMLFT